MRIELNGEPCELSEGATLADAVRESGAVEGGRGVAVALDGEVVPRDDWDGRCLTATASRFWRRFREGPRPGSWASASGAHG
jgi:sulfur carrier protein